MLITSEIMSPPTEAKVYWCNSTYQINIDQFAKVEFLQWSELSSKEQSTRTTISLNEASHIHYFHGALSEGWCRRDITVSAKNQSAENSMALASRRERELLINKLNLNSLILIVWLNKFVKIFY